MDPARPRPSTAELVHRHLQVGSWGLVAFVAMGLLLEALHAFKAPFYLDGGRETARLMLRLGHAHGTLVALLNVAHAAVLHLRPGVASRFGSASLILAQLLLPTGFLLGALGVRGADPGLGVLLAPPGAILLLASLLVTATRLGARASADDGDGDGRSR